MNNISNEGTGTNNIKVEGSYFLTDEGQNIFNISDFSTSYHLYGYFPQYIAIPYDETMNCFKVSGSPTNTPYNLVTDGYQGSQITFNFNPFLTGCDPEQGENMIVLDLGDGINDTIYSNGSGSGGGHFKQTTPSGFAGHPSFVRRGAFTPQNVNTAYDSICMLMRSRNYSSARTKCIEMISNYPDSIQSLNALAKLYLASVSSNANITDLKVFYENLILNHPNNTSLVKRANYYILKCKVKLHEYTSALAGFQQIINENPYSYEGLIARWDYMATSLLVPGGGGEPMNADFGFSIADLKAEDLEAGNPQSDIRDPNSWDDKSPFTKEQRVNIRKSINTAIESDKNDNDRKIRVLETKSDQGDLNAIKELAQVKALKQVVKTEKPRSITEHIKLVMEDIQKVFGSVTGGKGKDMSNIPTVYRLSQNYPNPFNPVTKINYDLPKDAKVNVIIYDILGREIKRLVNNELKTAGTYIIDFNAANYASGVYFYRIEAEELGGNKFVDSKKMVLIK
ncbi:MAG: T9SS type A sorting domain-containing protein [Ignavibacteria bacterium]|nr:T9SS type A sorting domain-containing protein [Ignavibacteria bacterium]